MTRRSGTSALSKLVGARVRAFREQAEITQAELGRRAGYSLSTVKRLEGGRMTVTVDHLVDVGKALRIRPTVLIARPPAEETGS